MLVVYNRTFKNSAVILSSSPPLVVILRRILIRSWHSEWLNTSWCSTDDGDNSIAPHDHHSHRICHKFFCQKFQPMLNTQRDTLPAAFSCLLSSRSRGSKKHLRHLTIIWRCESQGWRMIYIIKTSSFSPSSLPWLLLTPAESCQRRLSFNNLNINPNLKQLRLEYYTWGPIVQCRVQWRVSRAVRARVIFTPHPELSLCTGADQIRCYAAPMLIWV